MKKKPALKLYDKLQIMSWAQNLCHMDRIGNRSYLAMKKVKGWSRWLVFIPRNMKLLVLIFFVHTSMTCGRSLDIFSITDKREGINIGSTAFFL